MNRLFNGSDASFISFVEYRRGTIEADYASFTAFHPKFNEEYKSRLFELLDKASNTKSDNVYIDEQTEANQQLDDQANVCRRVFQAAKFFIEEAFPNKPRIHNQFGFNDYQSKTATPERLYVFMTDFYEVAKTYSAELIANQFTAEKIENIKVERDKLKQLEIAYNNKRMERGDAADNRVVILNELYEMLASIFRAAKVIFANDSKKLELYKFPVKTSTKETETVDNEVEATQE